MVSPPFPGQNPAQQQMQQQRQRMMEYAWWQQQQQAGHDVPVRRPGFFTRLFLGLISLALLVIMLGALFGAGWAFFKDDAPQFAAIGLGVAAAAAVLRWPVRRRLRSR